MIETKGLVALCAKKILDQYLKKIGGSVIIKMPRENYENLELRFREISKKAPENAYGFLEGLGTRGDFVSNEKIINGTRVTTHVPTSVALEVRYYGR